MRNTRAVSRIPLPLSGHIDHLATDLGDPAPILVLQEKDPPLALPVLTLIALGPVGLLARLDDLRAVTVGTLYRDETIGFLLALLSCEAIIQENYRFVTLPVLQW